MEQQANGIFLVDEMGCVIYLKGWLELGSSCKEGGIVGERL